MIEITGTLNPVKAAMFYFDAIEMPIHRSSFERVATLVGNVEISGGYIIRGCEELGMLCEMGNFVIMASDGLIVAMTLSEFNMGVTEQ